MNYFYEPSICKGNDLEFVDNLFGNMLLVLVNHASDDFWKILKYPKTDCLVNPNYTVSLSDKYNLIKQNNFNSNDTEITRVKLLKFNNDIQTTAHTEIRLFNGAWRIPEKTQYQVVIGVEIISHNKIIVLDNVGKTTLNVIRNEIYRLFNGALVHKSIGRLTNEGMNGSVTHFNDAFQGYQFSLLSYSA